MTLLDEFTRGIHDVVLTTEVHPGPTGEVLSKQRLVWTGAINGSAWRLRPLPIGFSRNCFFRSQVVEHLNNAGIEWRDMIETNDDLAGYAMVAADLCVTAELDHSVGRMGGQIPEREIIEHTGELPLLPDHSVVMYLNGGNYSELTGRLGEYLSKVFC